ncbi:MAG: hypothetical protein Q8S55_06865, partial [Methylococcaceae bacterium]|nr:hypothetical protein [Methylococcaceae bacterium]
MTDLIQNEVVPNKDSNSLMVFSFLLVGTSFMIFLLFIDYLFNLGFLNGMLILFKSFFTINEKLFIPISILVGASIYGIGFIIYCLSLPLLALPCYAFLNKFRSNSFKCVIITSLINASATSPVLMEHVSHHVGYVY